MKAYDRSKKFFEVSDFCFNYVLHKLNVNDESCIKVNFKYNISGR